MNLYIRLLLIIFKAFKKDKIFEDDISNDVTTRVMPNDLDLNLHVNNGRYMTYCDLARVDMFVRSGLAKLMIKNKWNPVIADHTMTYKRPLFLFDKIRITNEMVKQDEKFFYFSHQIFRGDKLMAEGQSKALVISKSGSLTPEFVMSEVRTLQAQTA